MPLYTLFSDGTSDTPFDGVAYCDDCVIEAGRFVGRTPAVRDRTEVSSSSRILVSTSLAETNNVIRTVLL